MSRKIITILLLIIFILIFCTVSSFASETMSVEGNTNLKEGESTVELTLLLGDLSGFTEGEPLGFQGTLTYDENIFQNIIVEGLNGWTINYEKTSKTFMGETDVANSNMEIAKVILTVKSGIEPGTSGIISFSNVLLTDGTNDYTLNKEITVTMEETTPPIDDGEENPPAEDEENPEEQPGEDNVNNTVNNNNSLDNTNKTPNTNTTTIKGDNPDKTTATTATTSKTSLPKAGLTNVLAVLVVLAVISMIVFKIKSKDIKY